jgi:hypothetical protein
MEMQARIVQTIKMLILILYSVVLIPYFIVAKDKKRCINCKLDVEDPKIKLLRNIGFLIIFGISALTISNVSMKYMDKSEYIYKMPINVFLILYVLYGAFVIHRQSDCKIECHKKTKNMIYTILYLSGYILTTYFAGPELLNVWKMGLFYVISNFVIDYFAAYKNMGLLDSIVVNIYAKYGMQIASISALL